MHDAMFDLTEIKIQIPTSFCPVSSYWVPKEGNRHFDFGVIKSAHATLVAWEQVLWEIDKPSDKIAHKVVGI